MKILSVLAASGVQLPAEVESLLASYSDSTKLNLVFSHGGRVFLLQGFSFDNFRLLKALPEDQLELSDLPLLIQDTEAIKCFLPDLVFPSLYEYTTFVGLLASLGIAWEDEPIYWSPENDSNGKETSLIIIDDNGGSHARPMNFVCIGQTAFVFSKNGHFVGTFDQEGMLWKPKGEKEFRSFENWHE